MVGLLEEENAEDNETERNFSMLLLEQSAVTSLDNQLVLNEVRISLTTYRRILSLFMDIVGNFDLGSYGEVDVGKQRQAS